ncbi:MAG: glycoside hydrolase family 3 C-terminal domain-containing protein [Bacteroidetes bacterium]|nr:glycoside hydrolase family 3 C-terminal domain-containing protein [Bacteroidota bacterium]
MLASMTTEEKIAFIGGDRSFFIRPIPRLNFPEIYMTDATQGVHIRESFAGTDLSKYQLSSSTSFPCPIALASTWNTEISYRYARAIGEECRAGNIGILLGPGFNNYRISQCGRNFEYFGEDPFLRAKMISEYVKGLQSTGTMAVLKHFTANNTDYFRRKSNSIVDERTLNEIYFPPFKAGIEAGAPAVMTAYNLLNGEWCGQSKYVIDELLRKQLGFNGLVMTDWWSVYDGEKVIKSGQDLEMPAASALKDAPRLLDEGKIKIEDIDRMVGNILRACFIMKLDKRRKTMCGKNYYEKHELTALQTAREAIVLLKNDKNLLPLGKRTKKILVTGEYAKKIAMGGGSAAVKGYNNRILLDELKREFKDRVMYLPEPDISQLKTAGAVICTVGTEDSEAWDRPFELPGEQEKKIKTCVKNNPNTVIIVFSGGGIRMTDWHKKAGAIIYAWYGGQTGNKAVAEIIAGKINPSGKLPISIEKEFKDSPGCGYLPKGAELYTGWHEEQEKGEPVYDIHYKEGVFAGYRWYEKKKIPPLYPFGFGFSYTSFVYSALAVKTDMFLKKGIVEINFKIKNIGKRYGLETAQIYIQDLRSSIPRPVKELKGFTKARLAPGKNKSIRVELTKKDFSFWNPENKNWFFEAGTFVIHVGSSSKDIRLKKRIKL